MFTPRMVRNVSTIAVRKAHIFTPNIETAVPRLIRTGSGLILVEHVERTDKYSRLYADRPETLVLFAYQN